ncbi:MAG TPA: type II toxin-antitoxin system prevent-host-death family antitoxin [Bryobacteraceae bacterium]|nr:type II toxin-antitoxin system prevent-host-death family antitoxin [Bryobacteraceae bacterium]
MKIVGSFEAKTKLASLLDRVAKGERIKITRHGVPVALLVPAGENSEKLTHPEIVEAMRELRREVKRDKLSVRQMIRAGRRF